jgi:Galactosyltransferase
MKSTILKPGFVCVVALITFACSMLLAEKQRVDGPLYAAHAARDNTALASRLCPAGSRKSVLYGVFSTAGKVLFRNATREQVQCGLNSNGHSTVFVVGAPRTEREHETMRAESAVHGDVFTLTCQENMNEGKSYTYFKEALQQLPCFDFYAKVDDDTAFAPAKLSAKLRSMPNDMALIIGRTHSIDDLWLLSLKWIYYGFRDLSWALRQNYTAGLLYVLSTQAVKQWIELNPLSTQLYGDEDVRTSYYMDLIGAKVINLDTAIHDYKSATIYNQWTTWKSEITNTSLAVHKCKTIQLLSDAFASLCA